VTGIGLQGMTNGLAYGRTTDVTISTFAKLGIKVNITELDVDVLPQCRTVARILR
jgi:GH35 family endo-1,4-beta-xylanase